MIMRHGVIRSISVTVVVAAAVALGACASTHLKIDDLAVDSMRALDARERKTDPEAVPQFMTGAVWDDVVFIEFTLSTSLDLAGAVKRDPRWAPYARMWQCAMGWRDGWMDNLFEGLYLNGREVRPDRPPHLNKDGLIRPGAEPRPAVNGRYLFAAYLHTRGDGIYPGSTYDLAKSPVDVCVEVAERGYYGSTSLKSNVVTIPAGAIGALLHRKEAR